MSRLTPYYTHYRSTAGDDVEHLTLLHDWGLHSIAWDDLMPALLERFQVTVVDLPGMGQSPLPNGDYTLDFLAQQVAAVMPANTHLLGWSLGGLVAIQLANSYPERVKSVATIATNLCYAARDDWPQAAQPVLLETFSQLVREDANGALVRFMALNCNGSQTQEDDIEKLKAILNFCGLPAARALREGMDLLQKVDMRDAAAKISQPLLMLFGENDAIIPEDAADAVADQLPHAQVKKLAGASHTPFISIPDEVARRLNTFWNEG